MVYVSVWMSLQATNMVQFLMKEFDCINRDLAGGCSACVHTCLHMYVLVCQVHWLLRLALDAHCQSKTVYLHHVSSHTQYVWMRMYILEKIAECLD